MITAAGTLLTTWSDSAPADARVCSVVWPVTWIVYDSSKTAPATVIHADTNPSHGFRWTPAQW